METHFTMVQAIPYYYPNLHHFLHLPACPTAIDTYKSCFIIRPLAGPIADQSLLWHETERQSYRNLKFSMRQNSNFRYSTEPVLTRFNACRERNLSRVQFSIMSKRQAIPGDVKSFEHQFAGKLWNISSFFLATDVSDFT